MTDPVAISRALLTLWLGPDGSWHAAIVTPAGERREFDNPFELARWSLHAVQQTPPPPWPAGGGGLR